MQILDTQDNEFDLSVIVPVYNAAGHLERLTKEVFALGREGLRCQMIYIDDNSTDESLAILHDLLLRYPDMTVTTNRGGRGAGIARNFGWPYARGRFTLFFDADDILHRNVLVSVIRQMDADPQINLGFCTYRFEREKTASFAEMGYDDEKIVEALLKDQPSATGNIVEMAPLLVFSNYPWNKLLRTKHYRKVGMRFGRTMVNNDILGHWYCLLLAGQITVLNEVICTHIVHPTGSNLTNILGARRLAMFEALEETYDFLESQPHLRKQFSAYFWDLTERLTYAAEGQMDPFLKQEFQMLHTRLLRRMDLDDLARMRAGQAPALATTLVDRLITKR